MNILGIDFEDWYHPKLIQNHLGDKKKVPIVINGIDKIIDWLRKTDTNATFFVVGELLEFKPEILDKILAGGHEIGFHTMHHTGLDTPFYREKFQEELERFNRLTSGKSKGFRAPTFSLDFSTAWAIDMLESSGYIYDSSIIPVKSYLYGIPNGELAPYRIKSDRLDRDSPDGKIIEFPLLTTTIFGKRIPAAGGFYVRTLPIGWIYNAISKYEKDGIPATMYIHSWELLPELMPKVDLPFKEKFITYHNIKKAFSRMDHLLKEFNFTSFARYITKSNT
ncbi:MAG: polysaccharide deacetylase family protein [Nitrososphaerota archaeon]